MVTMGAARPQKLHSKLSYSKCIRGTLLGLLCAWSKLTAEPTARHQMALPHDTPRHMAHLSASCWSIITKISAFMARAAAFIDTMDLTRGLGG